MWITPSQWSAGGKNAHVNTKTVAHPPSRNQSAIAFTDEVYMGGDVLGRTA